MPTSAKPRVSSPRQHRLVRLRLLLAATAMTWERFWDKGWPAVCLLAAGIALALTDVLPALPAFVHLILLIAFAGGVFVLAARGLRGFVFPSRAEARARLEAASPVDHRPLTTVEDTLTAGSTPLQRALWKRHQRQARAELDRLRSPWPAPTVARRDVFALRALVVLVLVIAAIGAWGDIGARLQRALLPTFAANASTVTIKFWVTPPAYTNHAPVFVEAPTVKPATAQSLEIPAGSKALIVVTGAEHGISLVARLRGQPVRAMALGGLERTEATNGATPAAGSSRLETVLSPADRLEVRRDGHVLAAWPVKWIPDLPPTVAIVDQAHDAGSGRLKIDYVADDDYGIESLAAHVTRTDTAAQSNSDSVDIALVAPPLDHKKTVHATLLDLAGSPWAGLPVTIQLVVTDQAGQSTTSSAVTATAPERSFTNPVAQEIARWRKDLMADPQKFAGPAQDALARLLEHPAAYNGDHIVTLALSSSVYRLTYQTPDDAMKGLPELLWQTAVRVEDGDRGAAESQMAAAEKNLQDAMARGASAEEIGKLVDRLQRALAEYTRALLASMPDRGADFGGIDNQGNIISPQDIAGLMDQMRQLTQMGARDAAKQLLSQIQNMLQTLRNAAAGGSDNPQMRAAEDLMRDMRQLTEAQSQLLNDSFNQARQNAIRGRHENEAGGAGAKSAAAQDKLRGQLNGVMQRVNEMTGQTPPDLNAAGNAMGDASAALKNNAWQAGAESQGVALARLQTAMQQTSQQILRSLAEKGVSGFMQMPSGARAFQSGGGQDGMDQGEQVDVPNRPDAEGMAQRARAILEELRRRASERDRPTEEQEYLRRLMKEF